MHRKAQHTGRVNDVDGILFLLSSDRHGGLPVAEGSRALDGDALLALELHAVHLRTDVVAFSDLHTT